MDRVGDSLRNPPCCRKRRPRQDTNESRLVTTFWQDLADQRLVDLVRRLCQYEGEPGESTVRARQTLNLLLHPASADRHRFTAPAKQIVMKEISNLRLDDAG